MPVNLLEDEIPQSVKRQPINLLADEMPMNNGAGMNSQAIPQESLAKSLYMAIPRVAGDIQKGLGRAVMAAPEYYEKAKTEIPGLASYIIKNKSLPLGQTFAGLAEAAHGALSAPSDIAGYLSKNLHLLPESIAKNIPRPIDISEGLDTFIGQPSKPGEALARGIARNLIPEKAAFETAKFLNPMRYTDKAIVKDVMDARNAAYNEYSGPNGHYSQLSDEAKRRGLDMSSVNFNKFDPAKIDIESVDELIKNKNFTNAQSAISDLGYLERRLKKQRLGDNWDSEKKERLKEVTKAKDEIQNKMFEDKSGNVHKDLLEKHKEIQAGYKKDVIPYTKSIPLNQYMKGEKLESELVRSLSKGKFAAQKGYEHPEIGRKKLLKDILYSKLLQGAVGASIPILGLEEYYRRNNQHGS